VDIKKMLSEAVHAREQQKTIKDQDAEIYDEFHAKQLAWSIPLLVAGRQLREEIAAYDNMKLEIGDVSLSLTVRLDSEQNGYANDVEFTVTAHLPTPADMGKRFICECLGAEDGEFSTTTTNYDSVEDAMSWLVKQAAKGIDT